MENKENQRRHFDFASVFSNTKKYIDSYNAKQSRLTDKINANQRATSELIIRLYLKQLNQAGSLGMLDKKLPGFSTYNSSLARCKGCTKRTIINHKERLKASGFITKEEHKGAGGIELWVNPQVLGMADLSTKAVDNSTETRDVSSLFYENVKNIHPLVHELQEHNNINSNVDKLSSCYSREERSGVRSAHSHDLPASSPPNPSRAVKATGTGHEPSKNTQKSVAPVLPKEKGSVKNLEEDSVNKQKLSSKKKHEQVSGEAGHLFLLSLVTKFWECAKAILYPDIIMSEPEEREVLNLIWESVYGKFRMKTSEKEWLRFHESAVTRIDMVAKWLSRSCSYWIPKPHLYFHPNNNRNGFKKTWEWYVRQETLKIEVRNQLALQRVKHELTQHSQGKGRFKNKSRLQLFRIHQKRLRQYKDQALMQAYHTCLLQSLHLNNSAIRYDV